ncbi:hypothetical protein [Micromonospora phytophila]|nr:hypothetical protein [Micromonospora phytophila]
MSERITSHDAGRPVTGASGRTTGHRDRTPHAATGAREAAA